jgi:rod shape-determining protein MreC
MFRWREKQKHFLIGIVVMLLFFFHYLGWLRFVEDLFRTATIPFSTFVNNLRVSAGNRYQLYLNRRILEKKINECTIEVQKLPLQSAKIKVLEAENIELKKQLNFIKNNKYLSVSANVVGKITDGMQRSIIIDVGENSKILIGQPVIVGEGILIGRVVKTQKDSSIVRLINDNQSRVAATTLNRDKSIGIIEGGYGLSIKMNFIPRDEIIMVSDQVVTSGLDPQIPRGLLIGEIAVSENESYQPFQQAIITSATDLNKLTVVSVLLGK